MARSKLRLTLFLRSFHLSHIKIVAAGVTQHAGWPADATFIRRTIFRLSHIRIYAVGVAQHASWSADATFMRSTIFHLSHIKIVAVGVTRPDGWPTLIGLSGTIRCFGYSSYSMKS
jgi:hypothetical protein